LLRVPSRALFLTGLGVASLAGYGTDAILNKRQPARVRFLIMALFGICLFAILLFVGIGFIGGEVVGSMFWGTLGLILSAVWIGLGVRNKLPTSLWVGGVLLIAVIDLVVFDLDSFVGKDADQVLAERGAVAQFIANTDGSSRTYSPSYSIPQQTAIHHGIRMADGVDPLQIAVYSQFMDQASGVPRDGYSVTIPYFSSGQPKTDNAAFVPDAEKLGLLNVGYVVSDFELHVEELKFERQLDGAFIYSNTKEGFSAWVQPGGISATDEKKPAEVVNRSPNRLEISATGPGTLIVSEIAYPGWSVLVDGVDEEMVFLDDLLMGVNLEPGPQRVEFIFRPRSVYIGMSLFVGGLVVLVWSTRSNKKQVTRG
jgi:hypothetical protein